MKRIVLILLSSLFLIGFSYAQLPKGDRTLAWQIDLAENNNYDSSFAYAYSACMESVHLFTNWKNIEPDTAVYTASSLNGFFDVMNIYYPAWGTQVELQIAPINTGVKEVPSELTSLPFDHPTVIRRFKTLLDTIFVHIPNVTLSALNIGNEGDVNFGVNPDLYSEYKTFLDSISIHAKDLYFKIHGEELKIGTTFTHHGLTDKATSDLCKQVNTGLDIVSATYYPLNNDFTMNPPSAVRSDFSSLVAEYPDSSQPIYFVECGYASSPLCNSNQSQQAQFWDEVFTAWDAHIDNIKYITVFKSTDWSPEIVDQLALYYGIEDPIFKEYLRTLGVRTWDNNGTNKLAYEQIVCNLDNRDWCATSCSVSNINKKFQYNYLNIHPNPAYNTITIEFNSTVAKLTGLKLYNSHGQLLRAIDEVDSNKILLERKDLANGLYFIQLVDNNKVVYSDKIMFR